MAPGDGADAPILFAAACREGIVIHDRGTIIDANPQLAGMLGVPFESLRGRPILDYLAPGDRERLSSCLLDPTHCRGAVDATLMRADGSHLAVEAEARTERMGGREVSVVVLRDVNARRAREDALHRREIELAAVIRQLPGVFWTTDDRLVCTQVGGAGFSEAAAAGVQPGRVIMDYLASPDADERAAMQRAHEQALAGEVVSYTVSNAGRTYQAQVHPLRGDDGAIDGVIGFGIDISALERAEAERREAMATLRGVVEQTITGIAIIQDGRFSFVNPRICEIFGYRDVHEMLALPSIDAIIHPSDRGRVGDNILRRLIGEVGDLHYAFRGVRKDGTELTVDVFGMAGEYLGRPAIIGTLLDITEQVRAREALRASEARFRALVESSGTLVAILDETLAITYASPGHLQMFGLAADGIAGTSYPSLLHVEDRGAVARAVERLPRGGTSNALPVRIRDGNGGWRTASITLTDLRDEPAVNGIVVNARDVTDQARLQEQLRQSQKMEAVGQLAGGVAHDFNNILAAVMGYAQLLRDALPDDDPRADDVDEIITAATRGAEVSRQLLAFSRRQAIETEVLDLARVARDTGRMLRSMLPPAIRLELPAADAAPVLVRASRAGLEQIILNLAANARDAMPTGGTLTLTTSRRRPSLRPPEGVLHVRDTGIGIPAEVRERIFEPFFTTKPVGKGTGLGLATVYGLAQQFGGDVTVDSEEHVGTTFTLALPLADAPAGAAAPTAHGSAARTRPARVLVVEDEGTLRALAERVLRSGGYDVVTAPDGDTALEILARADGTVDVLLTDAAMPRMSGWALAREVRTRRPDLPLVMMSGYAEMTGEQAAGDTAFEGFVQKPFTSEGLLRAIAGALDGTATS